MKERINKILEHWFLAEPIMFKVLCIHDITENRQMHCPVRSGRKKLEYNPDFVSQMSDNALEEAMRTEAIRILLKHPYERRPEGCSQQATAVGSNIVVSDNYTMKSLRLDKPEEYGLEGGMPYEWYARKVQEMLPQESEDASESSSGGQMGESQERLARNEDRDRDLSELWEEDEVSVALINEIIESSKEWGSLAGSFAEMIQASTRAKINWRHVLNGFRASILSAKRRLTRMKPSRRFGFDQMGASFKYETRILVAVDVSGSISSSSLSHFYGVINSAFKYGLKEVDVIQFDCGIRTMDSLRNRMKDVVAIGRGGTSFQEPIDYAKENHYDGLVMLTDGYAPKPVIPEHMSCKIIWVCVNQSSYDSCHTWMEESGRVCVMELP